MHHKKGLLVFRLLNILPIGAVEWWQVLLGGHEFPPLYQYYPPRPYEYGPKSLEKIVRHPNGGRLTYDIALLKMDSRVNLTPRIFPACFPGYEIQVVEFSNRGYKIRKVSV